MVSTLCPSLPEELINVLAENEHNKSAVRLPDREHAKAAVLNSLNSEDAKRGYRHAIDEFVDWYCSESRLAFNKIVVALISNQSTCTRLNQSASWRHASARI